MLYKYPKQELETATVHINAVLINCKREKGIQMHLNFEQRQSWKRPSPDPIIDHYNSVWEGPPPTQVLRAYNSELNIWKNYTEKNNRNSLEQQCWNFSFSLNLGISLEFS